MSKIWQKKRTLSRNYYNTKITDEYGRNLAKNTLHKLSPLVIKRSNYTVLPTMFLTGEMCVCIARGENVC